jgi:hypothetical protein
MQGDLVLEQEVCLSVIQIQPYYPCHAASGVVLATDSFVFWSPGRPR